MKTRLNAACCFLAVFGLSSACSFRISKPCQEAGDKAREKPFKGDRRCFQKKNTTGQWVNHGTYEEFFPDGKKALEGEYKLGKKEGRWVEWDIDGQIVKERFYEDGVEVDPYAEYKKKKAMQEEREKERKTIRESGDLERFQRTQPKP